MGIAIGTIKRVSERKLSGPGEPAGGVYDILIEDGPIMRDVGSVESFRLGDKVKIDRERMKIVGRA